MEIDDNELTSLTWLHSINILPQRSNNVSSKRKNNKSKLHQTKISSEKKHTSDTRTSPAIVNSTNGNKNENISLQSAQISHEPHTIISSPLNDGGDTHLHNENLKKSSDTIEGNKKITIVTHSGDLKKNEVGAEERFLQWRREKQWRNRSNPGKNNEFIDLLP